MERKALGLATLLLAAGCSHRDYPHSALANAKPELSQKYLNKVNTYVESIKAQRQQDLEAIAQDLRTPTDTPEAQESFYLADQSIRDFLQQEHPQTLPNDEITFLSKNFSDEGIRFSRTPFGYQAPEQHLSTSSFRDAQITTSILMAAFSMFDKQEDVTMYVLGGKEKDKCGGNQIYVIGPSDLARTSFAGNRLKFPSIKDYFVTLGKEQAVMLTFNAPETRGTRKAFDSMEILQRGYNMALQGRFLEPADMLFDGIERVVQSDEYAMHSSTVQTVGLERNSEALYVSFVKNLEDKPNLIYLCDYHLNDKSLMIIAAGNCPPGVRPMFFPVEKRPDQVSVEKIDQGVPVSLPIVGRPDTALTNMENRAR